MLVTYQETFTCYKGISLAFLNGYPASYIENKRRGFDRDKKHSYYTPYYSISLHLAQRSLKVLLVPHSAAPWFVVF